MVGALLKKISEYLDWLKRINFSAVHFRNFFLKNLNPVFGFSYQLTIKYTSGYKTVSYSNAAPMILVH